ncbi:uncharacterized protein Z518_04564 [Rhinocladiella mackenziei CBS 650.93]|uniref:Helix-turn-helix domain-containing protein n=1 Tax=Rhinocladiella mackenziei CBS 650.93 TaxID=1442369 RepID=A0A0D2H842_9EURO|nr:uncharacterized protein Z518_04564 [Rhinocladiella mackenziei CBS 650.93]KIX06588.1 hypothetical protein Z518_04564 [Rhinocladiella mackenziei CBS 650.93]
MGSSSSKIASKAAGAAARRQYPSTSSITNNAPSAPNALSPSSTPSAPSQVHPNPTASPPTEEKSSHIELDGRDPHFGSALRRIGPAKPASEARPHEEAFPTSSQPMQLGQNIFPSSPNNPAMMLVKARQRISKQWESEIDNRGRPSFPGRTLLGAKDIREALTLRDEKGRTSREVEKQMGLKPGILDQLLTKGVVANAR